MSSTFLLLCSLLLAGPLSAASTAPTFAGLSVGMSRVALLDTLRLSPRFQGADVTTDSNTVTIAAPANAPFLDQKVPFNSIKCLFNRKKDIQALTFIFPARLTDEVIAVYQSLLPLLGEPAERSSDKVGFQLEAEWHRGPYDASFFSSDVDFESYLLMAYRSFVKEEEARGNRSE